METAGPDPEVTAGEPGESGLPGEPGSEGQGGAGGAGGVGGRGGVTGGQGGVGGHGGEMNQRAMSRIPRSTLAMVLGTVVLALAAMLVTVIYAYSVTTAAQDETKRLRDEQACRADFQVEATKAQIRVDRATATIFFDLAVAPPSQGGMGPALKDAAEGMKASLDQLDRAEALMDRVEALCTKTPLPNPAAGVSPLKPGDEVTPTSQ